LVLALAVGTRGYAESPRGAGALLSPAERALREWSSELSDTRALGQVFMLGYPGTALPDYLLEWIATRGLGGVKIFTRNVASLDQLTATIQQLQLAAAPTAGLPPLLVATDQEGGWVRHIKHETSTSSGNLSLGASGLPSDAFLTGRFLGTELAALGINMNFAPTVDLYTDPDASVIGPRAFGSDPSASGLLAVAYYQGLRSAGVIATAKHFPGHGDTDTDSHGALPVVDVSLQQLRERELVPYRLLIREGLPSIMSGHLAFPAITEGELLPSSLASRFLRDILRGELGFAGVVITDDMEMGGALAGAKDPATAAVHALAAGNDITLLAHSPYWQERAWQIAAARMTSDADFRQQVRASALRVLRMKADYLVAPPDTVAASVPARGAEEFFFEAAARAVTVVRDARIPLDANAGMRILLVGQLPAFLAVGKSRLPQATQVSFPYLPFFRATEPFLTQLPKSAANYDLIIFGLSNYNSLQVLERLEPLADRIVVVSALTPVYLGMLPWVQTAIAVYGTDASAFRAGFGALLGDYTAGGSLPLLFE
jgi:beta-N-acetylhexosaminidase